MVSKVKKKLSCSSADDECPGVERSNADFEVASATSVQNAEVAISAGENVADAKATSALGVPVPDVEATSATSGTNSEVQKTSVGDANAKAQAISALAEPASAVEQITLKPSEFCPYCESVDFVKRGLRHNKFGSAQMYLCRNPICGRTFTASDIKGKKFPLRIIIDSMSYYNLGFTLEYACALIKKKFGSAPDPQTLSGWIEEYKPLCRYERLRPYAVKYCKPAETVEVVTMAHRQLYRFRYHRAKTYLMLEEFRNRNLKPLKEYLDSVSSETPHQYFQEGGRMSEIKSKFDKSDMIVKSKENFANYLAKFVLKAVTDNKARHEELQRFFIANDSCTVATEVPVYIRREDIEHLENVLHFKISDNGLVELKGKKRPEPMPRLLTGHIDFVQIRNGCVHLLDYKPNAAKEQPIEQLTWYAMAMSRLTGLRLFEFKCGWFDEKDYFEFYPLHVVKKLNYKRKRNVRFKDGSKVEIPSEAGGKAVVV